MDKPLHENSVSFEVWGNLALFSDPLTRTGGEKCTLPVPTYEALKGILSSIYFKPTIVWYIDSCRVMNEIQTFRQGMRPIKYNGGNDLAYYTYLTNVRYQVKAHFEWNLNRPELQNDRNENKHHNIAKRMIERSGRRDCFLGTRECYAYVKPCRFGEGEGFYDGKGDINFGFSYHGITYADEAVLDEDKGKLTVRFWNPVMRNGVIDFVRPDEIPETMKHHVRDMEIKKFGKEQNNFTGLDEFKFEGDEAIELD